MRWLIAGLLVFVGAARADFTATYERLPDSSSTVSRSWYGGDVLNDGRFLYGLGHSHNTNGDNSIWAFDPVTNAHSQLFANTGWKWAYDSNVAGSGHWSDPSIVALSNRNNHQQFYLPRLNQWVVINGTFWYQSGSLLGGRFDPTAKQWVNVSKSWAEFNTGFAVGGNGGMPANAATAVCKDLDTVVFFGGMANATAPVKLLEPNMTGSPEPYQWTNLPKPPIWMPAENLRESVACVGDTVYYVTAQERVPNVKCCRTPDPAPVWKFHVPSRAWTRLADGPPGGYFPTLTYDSDAKALLYYGGGTGGGSKAMWAYDLLAGTWQDLTGTTSAPRVDMMTAGFVAGYGHVLQGGRLHDQYGAEIKGSSRQAHRIRLTRVGDVPPEPPPVEEPPSPPAPIPEPEPTPPPPEPIPAPEPTPAPQTDPLPAGCVPAPLPYCPPGYVLDPLLGSAPPADPVVEPAPVVQPNEPPPAVEPQAPAGTTLAWAKIAIPGPPNSLSNYTKHWRIQQAGNGRVYTLGGDGNGPEGNTGQQVVHSFDPNAADGDWRKEANYCGTLANPSHWHTDEAGVAWDAKRGVLWKLAGTIYGADGSCPDGTSVKAKVIQFNPTTKLWTVPAGFDQKNIGYIANGVLDPVADQMIQITDKAAWHLDLITGAWHSYPLPAGALRFNAIAARMGRTVWFVNRDEALESYDLDTHKLTGHGQWPYPKHDNTWAMAMTLAVGDKVLTVWPTSGPEEPRQAALYDPATKTWAKIVQGDGWGNTAATLSDGRIVLMGGGINGPAYHNKFIWVGTLGGQNSG